MLSERGSGYLTSTANLTILQELVHTFFAFDCLLLTNGFRILKRSPNKHEGNIADILHRF